MGKHYRKLPELVRILTASTESLIVGSAVNYILDDTHTIEPPRDWDIIVPFRFWQNAVMIVNNTVKKITINSFGGFHGEWVDYEENLHHIDLWPSSIEEYLESGKPSSRMYKTKGNKVITIETL